MEKQEIKKVFSIEEPNSVRRRISELSNAKETEIYDRAGRGSENSNGFCKAEKKPASCKAWKLPSVL